MFLLGQKEGVMEEAVRFLEDTPLFSTLDQWSLRYIAGLAKRKKYGANEWLFRELAPWRWFGIVEKGEVTIVRQIRGRQANLAAARQGEPLGVDFLLDNRLHSAGGFTRDGA